MFRRVLYSTFFPAFYIRFCVLCLKSISMGLEGVLRLGAISIPPGSLKRTDGHAGGLLGVWWVGGL